MAAGDSVLKLNTYAAAAGGGGRRHNTRSELVSSRRRGLKAYEEQLFQDYEKKNDEVAKKYMRDTKLAGPKIFVNVKSDVLVQDNTWTDRSIKERGPDEIRTLKNIQTLNTMKLRQKNGLTKYPENDLGYEKY